MVQGKARAGDAARKEGEARGICYGGVETPPSQLLDSDAVTT